MKLRERWPLVAALVAYWVAVVVLAGISIRRNDGHFIYPHDDTYIHMAMAKNLALHHVWGVTRYHFSSSSSSPLWTVLLAGVWTAFGVTERMPLILNVIFGSVAVTIAYAFLIRFFRQPFLVAGFLLTFVFAAPLPTLTLIGMEHVLQACLSVAFVFLFMSSLHNAGNSRGNDIFGLSALAFLVESVRFEGVFLILAVCLLSIWKRRYLQSIVVAISGALPIALYGFWSTSHGWKFFPNSILLKGQRPPMSLPGLAEWFGLAWVKLIEGHLFGVLIVAACMLASVRGNEDHNVEGIRFGNILLIGVVCLQVLFARAGQFYRYEGYLICLSVLILAASIGHIARSSSIGTSLRRAVYLPLFFALGGVTLTIEFGERAVKSLHDSPIAATNIYGQQYQMAEFISRFYNGQTILLNDIGTVSFLTDIKLIDLWGLGSLEPAQLRLAGAYDTAEIFKLARNGGGKIAIVYDSWFQRFGGLPPEWIRVGRWTIPDNVVCGDAVISFYAVEPSAAPPLASHLVAYSGMLPSGVGQEGYVADRKDTNR